MQEHDFVLEKEVEVDNTEAKKLEKKLKSFNETSDFKAGNKLILRLNKASLDMFTKRKLNGRVESMLEIREFSNSDKNESLANLVVLNLNNKTLQLIDLDKNYIYLENHSVQEKAVEVVFNQNSNFLIVFYENLEVDVFQLELESIRQIVFHNSILRASFEVLGEEDFVIQNMIKQHMFLTEKSKLTADNPGVLNKHLKAYYNSFLDPNNFTWFQNNECGKTNKVNSIISYHLKSSFNCSKITSNDLVKAYQNSEHFLPTYKPVFFKNTKHKNSDLSEVSRESKISEIRDSRSSSLSDYKRNSISIVEVQQFHNFQNNLANDRFAFIRENLGSIPNMFLNQSSREDFTKAMMKKFGIKKSRDKIFKQIYNEFLGNRHRKLLTGKNENISYYFRFPIGNKQIPLFISSIGFENNEKGVWSKESISVMFYMFLTKSNVRMAPLFQFAKTNAIKVPFLKLNCSYQSSGNTLTIVDPSVESLEFRQTTIENNFIAHLFLMNSFLSFVVFTNRMVPSKILTTISNEILDQMILKRRTPMNVFLLVIYFFNDNHCISAVSQYLLNVFSKNAQIYKNKLKSLQNIKELLNSFYDFKSKNDDLVTMNPTKLDLTFLMATFILLPQSQWTEDPNTSKLIFWFLNFVE